VDLSIDSEALDHLKSELAGKEIFPISGASHEGVQPLLDRLWQVLQEEKAKEPPDEEPAEIIYEPAPVLETPEIPPSQENLLDEG
jgi:predicted GTPase